MAHWYPVLVPPKIQTLMVWLRPDLIDSCYPSDYGNPEEVLIHQCEVEPEIQPRDSDNHVEDFEFVFSLMHESDQELLLLHHEGSLNQREVGEVVSIAQPSICNRLQRLHAWLEMAIRYRSRIERIVRSRTQWDIDTVEEACVLHMYLRHHMSLSSIARQTGLSQSTLYSSWRRVSTSHPDLGEIWEKYGTLWTVPVPNIIKRNTPNLPSLGRIIRIGEIYQTRKPV